jgi:2-C-methyl-D-erythritol 4-phosphate cytidylyltransferase
MFVSAIVLAAGRGKRFGSTIPKPFVKLGGARIIEYSLKTLGTLKCVRQFIIAVSPDGRSFIRGAVKRLGLVNAHIVPGGKRRQDSVRNCLRALDSRAEIVLIHDGVRPFARKATVSAVIRQAVSSGAAIAAVPVKATIKKISGSRSVKETLKRDDLWEAQTPQAFRKDLIVRAYCASGRSVVTDDASLVEKLGHPVSVVMGEYANIKMTTPEDMVIARALLKRASH